MRYEVVLFHDNSPSDTEKLFKETIEVVTLGILAHAAYPSDLAPAGYHLWDTLSLNNALIGMKMYGNGSITGLLQTKDCFFGVAFINCWRAGKK